MHNGVLHTCVIDGHDIEICRRATMVGLNTNGCIHSSSEYFEYTLRIDGFDVRPPAAGWTDAHGNPFGNIRKGTFDTPNSALQWAWYTITGNQYGLARDENGQILGISVSALQPV